MGIAFMRQEATHRIQVTHTASVCVCVCVCVRECVCVCVESKVAVSPVELNGLSVVHSMSLLPLCLSYLWCVLILSGELDSCVCVCVYLVCVVCAYALES